MESLNNVCENISIIGTISKLEYKFRLDNAFFMAASKRLPYRSYCCCVSSPFDIRFLGRFLGKIPLFEGRPQRPWPFLIRSIPGRD